MTSRCVEGRQRVSLQSLSEVGITRIRGLDRSHVEMLAERPEDWPPILVLRDGHRIVDGHHRVAAARMLNMTDIEAEWFGGTAEQAYIESIRRNTGLGLPLKLRERVKAATIVLKQQSDWSDRRLASLCGLSATTIARIRSDTLPEENANRLGSDGRNRPARPQDARLRVLSALEKNPTGSLRSLASVASVSPETVRSIKRRLQTENQEPAAHGTMSTIGSAQCNTPTDTITAMLGPESRADAASWQSDVAFASCDSGDGLVNWLCNGSGVYDWPNFVAMVPLSRVYEIADEARRRALAWTCLANALEARAGGRESVAS